MYDYSRYTWTLLIVANKSDSYHAFKKLVKHIQNQKDSKITSIRSGQEGEFENNLLESFYNKHGINHNFCAPRTPQQNGLVERKNRSLKELTRTMINETNLPKHFWADVVNTACYVMNRALRSIIRKTPYELFKGRKSNITYLRVFGCKWCWSGLENNKKKRVELLTLKTLTYKNF